MCDVGWIMGFLRVWSGGSSGFYVYKKALLVVREVLFHDAICSV